MFQNECPAERTTQITGDDTVKAMLRFDLERTTEKIRLHREQVSFCETIGVYALAERIRELLVREQKHQVELATTLKTGC